MEAAELDEIARLPPSAARQGRGRSRPPSGPLSGSDGAPVKPQTSASASCSIKFALRPCTAVQALPMLLQYAMTGVARGTASAQDQRWSHACVVGLLWEDVPLPTCRR